MLKQLTTTQVWVHDQDEALAFYTEKLGLELREDVTVPELGNFRWLSVGVPGQPDIAITLMAIPGQPVVDALAPTPAPPVSGAETQDAIKTLVAKGVASGLFFATDDVQATYEELKDRGVEFQQEPTEQPAGGGAGAQRGPPEQPYGVDAGFRDPSGNQMRVAQRR